MSGHTPGPWHVAHDDKNGQAVVSGLHTEVATCWHHCVVSIEKQMRANAHLIAAAPEMLEALKKADDQIVFALARLAELRGIVEPALAEYVERNTTLIAIRAAIAKAEGRQP